ENFRRGGYLDPDDRYIRAEETLNGARAFWDSWESVEQTPRVVDYHTTQFDITGTFNIPQPPQGHPVIFQSGDSTAGRDFAPANATSGSACYADIHGVPATEGRHPDDLNSVPGVRLVIAATERMSSKMTISTRCQQSTG